MKRIQRRPIHFREVTTMNPTPSAANCRRILLPVLAAGLAASLSAQGFDPGSDGSDGALNPQSNLTMDLPPDGIIHATTVSIPSGVTLKFNRNELNTPVYLLATGAVTIGGTIDVSGTGGGGTSNGLGGPGGFDGGAPPSGGGNGGHGLGPGGGGAGTDGGTATGAGAGSYAGVPTTITDNTGDTYGNQMLIPLIGGSGGGACPASGGGGGGGAILIASNVSITFTHGSIVRSNGGSDPFGGARNEGSGGALRFVAPVIASSGSVFIDVGGGTEEFSGGANRGGHGRIRLDALDMRNLNVDYFPDNAVSSGSIMVAIPTLPKISLANVAGTAIAEDTTTNAAIFLPPGSSTTQLVTVRVRDFGTVVPIKLVVTPANGVQTVIPDTIDNTSVNPATKAINITVPVDMPVDVAVWTGS